MLETEGWSTKIHGDISQAAVLISRRKISHAAVSQFFNQHY